MDQTPQQKPSRAALEKAARMVMAILKKKNVNDVRDREELTNDILRQALADYDPGKDTEFSTWACKKIAWRLGHFFEKSENKPEVKKLTELMPSVPDDDTPELAIYATVCRAREQLDAKHLLEYLVAAAHKHKKKGPLLVDFLLLKAQSLSTGEAAEKLGLTKAEGNCLRDVLVDHLRPFAEEWVGMPLEDYFRRAPNKK